MTTRPAPAPHITELQPGDEGTCGHAVYPDDPDRDVQCMRVPDHPGQHAPAEAIERHKLHGFGDWANICGLCRDEQEQDAADSEAAYCAEVDQLTCTLADTADDADRAIAKAQQAITRLLSKEVYDEELMGATGNDLAAELETAARAMRHVKRIAAWRREILLAADPRMTGPAAPTASPDVLSSLLEAAGRDDYLHEQVCELARKAGVLWQCQAERTDRPGEPCNWDNRADEDGCGGCGAERPVLA